MTERKRFSRYYLYGVAGETKHFFHTALDEDGALKMAPIYLDMFKEYDFISVETLDGSYNKVIGRGYELEVEYGN